MEPSSIPTRMRAAVLEEFDRPYVVREVDTPSSVRDHDILVRVLAASYCHTDAVLASGSMSRELPRIGCHEFAGQIIAMGSQVSPILALSVGDEVGVPGRAYNPCGSCYECTLKTGDPKGYSPYCPRAKNLGLTTNGGFCEYALADSRQIAKIPEGLTALETAPLMCAGLTIWAALQRVQHAKTIAIIGAGGGLGHLGVQFAAHLGKKTLAVDAGEKPMLLLETVIQRVRAVDATAEITVADARKHDTQAMLKMIGEDGRAVGENGVEAVILLPELQVAFNTGMSLLRNHGTMVVVSFPERFEFSAKDLVFRDITLIGSLVGRNYQLREMLDFAARYNIRAISKVFSLGEINNLCQAYHTEGGGKFIIDMLAKE